MRSVSSHRFIRPLFLVLLFSSQPFKAQNSSDQTTPIFKAETRQVLVDVVVTDHGGHFIPGLKPSDFTVLEDGSPQKIAAFGAHLQPATAIKPAPPIRLPPNQYTNYQSLTRAVQSPLSSWMC